MRKRTLYLVLPWLPLALAMACGGDDSSGSGFDAGAGGDSGGGDGSVLPDTGNGGGDSGQSGGDSGQTGDGASSSGDGSSGSADGSWSFDGFDKGDGSYCFDDDGDGFTTCDGDCNDHDALVNPCAFDTDAASGDPVGTDGIDNDCDGQIDNRRTCDGSLTAGHGTSATDYARAMDICEPKDSRCTTLVSATWYGPNNASAHRLTKHMGNNFTPHVGSFMAYLATGIADDLVDSPNYRPGDGTDLLNTYTHPDPLPANKNINPCGQGADEGTVAIHDYSELRLTVTAPVNAGSFAFDFNFFSMEYPAYACQGFNDTFLAMLTSQKYQTPYEIAFDPNNARINVNNGFFQDCNDVTGGDNLGYTHTCTKPLSTLNGTGYEIKYGKTSQTVGNLNKGSGATDWLKTTAPIQAGETFTISFIIFDEGDGILDSAVNLDNFRWGSASINNPVTAR